LFLDVSDSLPVVDCPDDIKTGENGMATSLWDSPEGEVGANGRG